MIEQVKNKINKWLREPVFTYLFLIVTTLVFIGMEFDGGSESSVTLYRWGALYRTPAIIALGEYWRFITPIFLHIGWMHFIVNMVTLYYVGSQIENIYGHWRFFVIYIVSGIAGNIASYTFGSEGTISAGASTSLFGLFGAFIILGRYYRGNPAINMMVQRYSTFVLINLVFNLFSSSVDILGHLGGLIGGFLIATILAVPNKQGGFNIHHRIISAMVLVFLLVICFMLGLKKYGFLV